MTERRLSLKSASLDVSDAGEITGLAWPFGSPDSYGDTIQKGAFSSPSDIPMLFDHDTSQVIGVWNDIKETSRGLEVRGRLLIDEVPRASEVRAMIRSKAVTGLSIGFIATESNRVRGGGSVISALELKECSVVPVPAHPGAQITSIKTAVGGKGTPLSKAVIKNLDDNTDGNVDGGNTDVTLDERVTALESDVAEIKDTINGTATSVDEMNKSLKTLVTKSGRPGIVRTIEKPEELERKAFVSYLRSGSASIETKSLRRGSDPKGGYLAPAEFVKELIRELVEYSPIRENAYVGSTGNASVVIPGRVGRTNAKWKGETETQEESTFDFEEQEIAIHEINTFVDVSNQLLEDAEIDVEAEIRLAFAEDLGGKENQAFLFGDGIKKPNGFMVDPRVLEFPSGAATAITADGLIAMLYSLPQVYRDGSWIMNGTTLGKIRTLKDGQGNYIWQPGLQAGQPETILGKSVVEALDMPDVAAGANPIAFGDLKQAFRIYDRTDIEVLVNPYLLATESKTRFHLRKRLGAGVVRPLAIKKLKIAAS